MSKAPEALPPSYKQLISVEVLLLREKKNGDRMEARTVEETSAEEVAAVDSVVCWVTNTPSFFFVGAAPVASGSSWARVEPAPYEAS